MHGAPGRRAEIDDASYVELTVDLGPLPLGYHELTVRAEGEPPATARLICCPDRAYFPKRVADNGRAAGVGFSLYGIRSDRNWGCGDFTDLERVAEWVVNRAGASFVALNPLHSIPNRQPYNTSPYLPNCAFYKNPIYIDVERVTEFANSPWAQTLVGCHRTQEEIRALRDAKNVEYERVFRLKKGILRAVFRTFLREIEARQTVDRRSSDGWNRKASFSITMLCFVRSTRFCISATRTCGCGRIGPNATARPIRQKHRNSPGNTGAQFYFSNTCSGLLTSNLPVRITVP